VNGDATFVSILGNTGATTVSTVIGGNDTINSGGQHDRVYGDTATLRMENNQGTALFQGGDDTLNGEGGNDWLIGDIFRIKLNSNGGGTDTVIGGNDTINGGAGDDSLIFGDFYSVVAIGANATVIGGNDIINGGTGNDHMWGDFQNSTASTGTVIGGSDTFVFDTGSGIDTVHDFEINKDLLDVSGYGHVGIGDVTITVAGGDTTVDLGGGNSILLIGVTMLDAGDFIFA